MKIVKVAAITVVLVGILVLGLSGAAWWLFGRGGWGVRAQGPATGGWTCPGPGSFGGGGWGSGGMMGGYYGRQTPLAPQGQALTIEQAKVAVEQYIAGDPNLVVDEVMEFKRNFYALVKELDSGSGAMELLVDKQDGGVFPEYGPNMMWNAKYGMMGRGGMMGGRWGYASGLMTVAPAEALQIAQRWLDVNKPGVVTESQADPFYGYYTIHTLKDGKTDGMLSVHGDTGQVWYHTWHGEFIDELAGVIL